MKNLPPHFVYSHEVLHALKMNAPMVALESAVITHGLPRPHNYNLACDMEKEVRSNFAVPATIALMAGDVHIGMTQSEIEQLAYMDGTRKISVRDFGIAAAGRLSGGTTVAGTLFAAHTAGIRVFATGGIGGIHRGAPFDVSADLPQLGKTPLVVVCAGAKAILDIPATIEYLETQGVPIIGYQTEQMPAFYSRESGFGVDYAVDNAQQVAQIAHAAWQMGLSHAVLVVVPPPASAALERKEIESIIKAALVEAESKGIHGAAATPFLLQRVGELSGGDSLRTNLELLCNNARVAAQIAAQLSALDAFPNL